MAPLGIKVAHFYIRGKPLMQKVLLLCPLVPFKSACKKDLFIFLLRNSIFFYGCYHNDICSWVSAAVRGRMTEEEDSSTTVPFTI